MRLSRVRSIYHWEINLNTFSLRKGVFFDLLACRFLLCSWILKLFCNPLFVEKVEQNHRKAKFVGSPLVVSKMIATHFWKPSKGHHFLTLRLRVALYPQTFAVRSCLRTEIILNQTIGLTQTRQATFRRRYACSMSSNAPWLTKSSVLRQPKRGRQLFGKRADGKICVKKRRPFHVVKVRMHPF